MCYDPSIAMAVPALYFLSPHIGNLLIYQRFAIKSKAPILLMGPTGAGKSFLARRVFELKKARHQLQGKFVELNCATLHGDGAGSTLFGHIKGAFTGAASDRPGLLRAAHKGLLFLDEIGELGPDEQAMLLKAIEEKRFLPVGSDHEVQSDFQLIAGTNRDLSREVVAGRFREDLYARINLWTGNFRDLSASVVRMATLADAGRITDAIVADEIIRLKRLWRHYSLAATEHDEVDLEDVLSQTEIEKMDLFDVPQLKAVIGICRRSKSMSDAGRKLFAASRDAKVKPNDADRLKKYSAKFGLNWDALTIGSTHAAHR